MKNFSKFLRILLIFTILLNSKIFAQDYKTSQNYYLGVDVLSSTMKMNRDYGGNIFAKTAPGVNLSFGKMFNDYLGFELGHEIIKNKTKNATINAPEAVLGVGVDQIVDGGFKVYKSKIKRSKTYLGLTSKFYFTNTSFTELLLGAALVKIKNHLMIVTDGKASASYDCGSNSKNKILPTLRLSLGTNISNNFGIKTFFSWTKSPKNMQVASRSKLELKNSTNFGIGLIYYI